MLPADYEQLRPALRELLTSGVDLDRETISELLRLAHAPNQVIREMVLRLLGRARGNPEVYDELKGQLTERFRHFRAAAASALGEYGDPRAIPYLRDLLDDPALAVRQEAKAALRKLGDSDGQGE